LSSCLESIRHGKGGSCAHFSPLKGWSKPYPETTGYLIPTLLKIRHFLEDDRFLAAAKSVGQWLLEIQNSDGSWHGGLHPGKSDKGSVFNTGQILKGMAALSREGHGQEFLDAGIRGAQWLTNGVDANGMWPPGDYKAEVTPSYYTHVAWPMLEIWKLTDDEPVKAAATRYLDAILKRRNENGSIANWGFKTGGMAFTHTIAYTIRGFQESARLLDDTPTYGKPMEKILESFVKKTELSNGKLAGEFSEQMEPNRKFVCLTGNAQIAICLLIMEQQAADLRLVNAAAKLVDYVNAVQRTKFVPAGMKGGVAGSSPLWGKYMFMRYPNWAAKYHCDALLMLINRLKQESS